MAVTSWFVEVIRVTSLKKQQHILELFHSVAGLTVMGASVDHDHFVVLGSVDNLMKSAAEVLIADIDPDSVCTYMSGPRARLSQMTPSADGIA